jgi:ubiquinone/menaquinone biosynthesis C-methylase UbiE
MHASHAAHRRRFHFHLLALLAAGAALALILRAHGVLFWYLVVAAHAIAFAAIGVAWMFRHHAGRQESAGALLHSPRFYDLLVRFLVLGRERKLRRRILGLAELRSGDAILDVGCGTGTLLLEAATLIGNGGSLCGAEPSPEMAAHARRKAAKAGVALAVAEAPADRLPYPDASFDVVFCTLVLHHIPADRHQDVLAEMRRVLRPAGLLVIVDLRRPRSLGALLSLPSLIHGLARHSPTGDPETLAPAIRGVGFDAVAPLRLTASLGALTARRRAD